MLRELTAGTGGIFLVVSGRGVYTLEGSYSLPEGAGFQGTLCALSVRRADTSTYTRQLREANRKIGLSSDPNTFDGVFR